MIVMICCKYVNKVIVGDALALANNKK